MRQYDSVRAHKPIGIENKKFHIIGGGIAGLASAVFLIDDCYVDPKNIVVYEKLKDVGGSMDAEKIGEGQYTCRGERELEPYMECLWYLFNKIPSIDTPGRTVTEETRDANIEENIFAHSRVLYKQGEVYPRIHDFKMSKELSGKIIELVFEKTEEELEDLTIDDYFGNLKDELYSSSMWICLHSMLAFKNYHSILEFKRYIVRFMQHQAGMEDLRGILHTKYNEYDSMIKPMKKWLLDKGITIRCDESIKELIMSEDNNTVLGFKGVDKNNKEFIYNFKGDENVILTNGSMTTNSTFGSNKTVCKTNRDNEDKGVFSIWEKLAARDSKFGHPEKFDSDIEKSKWMSCFLIVKGYPEFANRIWDKYGYKRNTQTGAITILDSSWDISMCLYPKYYPTQKDDENIIWFDTLYGENNGDFIKKPSSECTGEEIVTEFLYHLGMLDMKEEVLKHSYISTCMMPYITSQFLPRKVSDRPNVIPKGCTNLAFIGQFVEIPGDVVFTVETSIRTAMMAAYSLTKIDKPVVPLYQGQFDLRMITLCLKQMSNRYKKDLREEDLPDISIKDALHMKKKIVKLINEKIPDISDEYEILY